MRTIVILPLCDDHERHQQVEHDVIVVAGVERDAVIAPASTTPRMTSSVR